MSEDLNLEFIIRHRSPWEGEGVQLLFFFLLSGLALIVMKHRLMFRYMFQLLYMHRSVNLPHDYSWQNVAARVFLIIQRITLSSILYVYAIFDYLQLYKPPATVLLELYILITFVLFVLFSVFKNLLKQIVAWTFFSKKQIQQYKDLNYSLFSLWGISLYVPSFFVLSQNEDQWLTILTLIIPTLLLIYMLLHKLRRIFAIKGFGLFSLLLYLCALEILPLYLLYKGSLYTYNLIEAIINTWQ